jgi:hypothetical protein
VLPSTHVLHGAPWPSPSRTLHSAGPVFTKLELVLYTQSCISVYEIFITSYITYTCQIDDLHLSGHDFIKLDSNHELIKVERLIPFYKSPDKTAIAGESERNTILLEKSSDISYSSSTVDEVQPRQCTCLRAFDSWSVCGIRRTRRRSQ